MRFAENAFRNGKLFRILSLNVLKSYVLGLTLHEICIRDMFLIYT